MKLKLTRDELQVLCTITNPVHLEESAVKTIREAELTFVGDIFCLIEIGEKAARKFLFDHKKKYSLTITMAQATAFWNYADWNIDFNNEYQCFVITKIKGIIHEELINYKRKYFLKAS